MDGLTRWLMPDRFELNPLSAALGETGSLAWKAGLVLLLVMVALACSRPGRVDIRGTSVDVSVLGVAVLTLAALAGWAGALSNVPWIGR